MSLIDEALKRARQEAARQDAAQRYAYPATPAQVPARDRSRRALLTGLAAGLVIGALAIGGTLLVTRSRSGEERAAAPSTSAETAAPLPVSIEELSPGAGQAPTATPAPPAELPVLGSPAPVPIPVPTPAPPARVEVPAIEVQPRPAPTAAAPSPAVAAPRPSTPPVAEPQAPPPAASAPPTAIAAPPPPPLVVPAPDPEAPGMAPAPTHTSPPATPPAQPEPGLDGRTFVRELPVPGGGRLELRGIASGSQPAALINGRVIGQGEVIEGFTVVSVEARRVQLRGYGATVYLSLDPEQ